MTQDERSARLQITGRVQGVGYRDWVVDEATALGLHGWVRNRRDGSVEVMTSGPAAAITALVEACRRGPRSARVTNVEIDWSVAPVIGSGFGRLPTA
jgi:acylphosphatase